MNSPISRSYPRTNALGTAKVDCHTCLRLRRHCDRQRPQCGPCLEGGRKCGGFVMDIVWKNERRPRRARESGPTTPFANVDEKESQGPWRRATPAHKPIRFVQNGVKRRRKTSKLPDVMKAFMTTVRPALRRDDERTERPSPVTEPSLNDFNEILMIEDLDQSVDIVIDSSWPETRMEFLDPAQGTPSSTLSSSQDSPSQSLLAFNDPNSPDNETQWQRFDSGQITQVYDLVPAQSAYLGEGAFNLSPGPLFSSPAQKAAAILDMYDQEFCILPLTTDCPSNPFRIRQESCEGSAFLLHAMLAISSQHLAKKNKSVVLATETWNHHATALRLFSDALDRVPASTLLDTLLLLVNFEATQSASSTWAVHIGGAQKLLESMGGVKVCQKGSRARAQVAMIVWWDVTVAMISRKRPLLDLKYLKYLMAHGEEEDDSWTFFGLNGCPAEFIMFMARLSILAATYETVQTMEWVTFSTVPVEAIMAEVQGWTNPEDATAESIAWSINSDDHDHDDPEDDPNTRRTRFHCIEAWRHAILLYAHRVFYRPQTTARLRSITHLARIVLDHVRCIPDTSPVQKQTLLPVFLAAAETGDEATRDFVRGYCAHWTAETRYSMIGTVEALLECIWADWRPDSQSRRVYWWGTKAAAAAAAVVVDKDNDNDNDTEANYRESKPRGDRGLVSELLFG